MSSHHIYNYLITGNISKQTQCVASYRALDFNVSACKHICTYKCIYSVSYISAIIDVMLELHNILNEESRWVVTLLKGLVT